MKATLLKKVRKQVRILNSSSQPANKTDKFCTVVVKGKYNDGYICKTSKGSSVYINFGNARNKHREVVLANARLLNNKPWWNVFS